MANRMLCESCHVREASCFLTSKSELDVSAGEPMVERKRAFCTQCADAYFACTSGMRLLRELLPASSDESQSGKD